MRKLFEKLSLVTLSSALWWVTEHLLDKEVSSALGAVTRFFLHLQS